eukprot:CAMPEP_0175072892 /NCGR_PEP_ID=MMETSP0052_2-20121109/20196_1 /TAXON_ID=51329 ORGANISM="Polytomella parva, Strain SAG 63-3" /NCGR_SAMPLE_ID=MMETSP0052_2 /ASSEMBLY_ACC=CAM_ASM_000194 /LENGTH=450 /DNA_ID=CAMNT_0016340515 /DNA_START=278 /DNA_END=1630 /DNA_ORIENTATION=+
MTRTFENEISENDDYCSVKILPWKRTKKIVVIRHGEGFHNVAGKKNYANYKSPQYEDAQLTPLGWDQARSLGRYIRRQKIHVDLVVVSPMTRALQTAVGVFGIPSSSIEPLLVSPTSPLPFKLLMPAQEAIHDKQSPQEAFFVSTPLVDEASEIPDPDPRMTKNNSLNSDVSFQQTNVTPPFISHELCREIIGLHPCDRRSETAVYRKHFPGIDFSKVTVENDIHWRVDERESHAKIKRRGSAFLRWLMQRPEETIAVVSHASFLHHLIGERYETHERWSGINGRGDIGSSKKGNHANDDRGKMDGLTQLALDAPFDNCEMRTVVISDSHESEECTTGLLRDGMPGGRRSPYDKDLSHNYVRMFMGWELAEAEGIRERGILEKGSYDPVEQEEGREGSASRRSEEGIQRREEVEGNDADNKRKATMTAFGRMYYPGGSDVVTEVSSRVIE